MSLLSKENFILIISMLTCLQMVLIEIIGIVLHFNGYMLGVFHVTEVIIEYMIDYSFSEPKGADY